MTSPIIAALLTLPARPIPGAALLARLAVGGLATEDEFKAAVNEANRMAYRSKEVVKRCLELKPVPAPKPPRGF